MKIRQKAKEIGFIENVDYPYSFDEWADSKWSNIIAQTEIIKNLI